MIKVYWISTFIIILGIFNIISGIVTIPIEGFLLKTLTKSILVFSGFSSLFTGFTLTIMGYGLFKGFRLAWRVTTMLLVISFFVNLFEGLNIIGMALSSVFLFLLYSKRGQFVKPLGIALNVRYLMAVWIIAFVLFYGTVGGYFLGEHFRPPITTFTQALYYTVITATTVGYGDFVPYSDQARLFAVSLILLGVGTFLSAIVLIIQPFMREMEKIMTAWAKSKKE